MNNTIVSHLNKILDQKELLSHQSCPLKLKIFLVKNKNCYLFQTMTNPLSSLVARYVSSKLKATAKAAQEWA